MQLGVAVRDGMNNAFETVIGASPLLRVMTGAMPATPATAQSGTQLVQMTLPSDWMNASSAAVKTLLGTWAAAAAASGLGGYARIYDNAGTTCGWQGLVSQAWAQSTAYILNQQASNANGVYRVTTAGTSNASGTGPSGTGTGITDGTVTWSYVGPVDMVLDNTNIATAQNVSVTTFTLTGPNP